MDGRALRLYRRLLVLLPARMRDEAEDELLETFRQEYVRVASRSAAVRGRFWLRMVADLAAASVAERTARPSPLDLPAAPGSPVMRVFQSTARAVSDARLAARRLARTPGWTAMSAGTLALGLAASMVAAVLVRDVLLRPLPFPHADRLVRIVEISENGRAWWPSYPNATDWREQGRMFDGVAIADIPRVIPVRLDGRAVRVPVSRAARGMFETLGVQPIVGRLFAGDENSTGGPAAAIVGERFWRRELAARPLGDLGVTLGSQRYTIVGVLPAHFRFLGDGGAWTEPADIWTAMDRDTDQGSRTTHGIHVVGRIRDGLSLDQARIEMNELTRRLKTAHGEPTQADAARLTPLQEVVIRTARAPLQLLLYAAGAVLLVSCLNLAAAILAQGLNRGRELSVRLALGATRWTLARHLLTEAAMLAVPGAMLGLILAGYGFRIIKTSVPGTLPRLDEAVLDAPAIAIAFGLAALTACVAGVIPALILSRTTVADRLRTHGATTGPKEQRRIWTGFVIAQVTLTVVLLTGTGLLIRSFMAALAVDLGYDARHVLAVDVALPEQQYGEPDRRIAFYDAALDRLRATSGVRSAGLTSALPQVTSIFTGGTARDADRERSVMAGFRLVDPGYFEAIGMGRPQGSDRPLDGDGAVVDRRLVDMLWSGRPPFGDRVTSPFASRVLRVSAVVGTVREWNQGDDDTMGIVYADFHQHPQRTQTMYFVVRYEGGAGTATASVRSAFAALDPMVPVTIEPLETRVAESLGGRRLQLLLASGFGIVALLLAAAGVYAMVAFVVGRQLREAAIRLALGARPSALRRRVILQGLYPVVAGIVLGVLLALPMGQAMRAQLFHVRPADPAVVIAAAVAVVLAAILASVVPARRAARVDPAAALRQE